MPTETLPTTKRERARLALLELAAEAGDGNRLPTLRELIARLGVSQATVVGAIADLEAQGVLQRRHGSGIYVTRPGGNGAISILCDPVLIGIGSSIYRQVIETVLKQTVEWGGAVSVDLLRPQIEGQAPLRGLDALPEGYVARIRSGQIGVIMAILVYEPTIVELQRLGCRVVSLYCPGDYIVLNASLDATATAVAELASRGCRRIRILHVGRAEMIEVFRAAARMHGIPHADGATTVIEPHDIGWGSPRPDEVAEGYAAALRWFGPGCDPAAAPDGVWILHDVYASGFLSGLDRLGVVIGRDVHVVTVSHRDCSPLYAWEDRITRIEFDPTEMGRLLAHALNESRAGRIPVDQGWERAVRVRSDLMESRDLAVQPRVLRAPSPSPIREIVSTQ